MAASDQQKLEKCDSDEVKNLASASREDQESFFRSFYHVLMDMDGVVWVAFRTLSGAPDCIANFKKLGKRITFVTNNTTVRIETMCHILKQFQVSISKEDVINPSIGYIHYLKKNNIFYKQVFVIGGQGLKDELKDAGFNLAPSSANPIDETLPAIATAIDDNQDIGAVIVDYDVNLTLMKLQKCLTYLKRKDCLFITGTSDKILPFTKNGPLIGNHYFLQSLIEISGRNPYQMAKPSSDFNDFIIKKLAISDPSKVLFIGDSINEDMEFASVGGYKKLLVLTGNAQKEDVLKWTHGERTKPDYYIESIGALNLILGKLMLNKRLLNK